MTKERKTRLFANHVALSVRRRRGSRLMDLYDRYELRRKVGGPFRTWKAVERALLDYCDAELERLKAVK
jgi:hypothetical protein